MSARRLTLQDKLAYGCGDFASVLYWQTFMVYLTYFYTDVFGLSAAAAGAMLGVSRSADAVLDPLVGMLADRTRTRFGRFRPYLLWLAIPFALAGVLTFTVPELAADDKLIWAWVTYNLLMVLYTGINIPYTSLLGVITPDPNERTQLSSVKFVCAFSAGLVISVGLLPMVRALGAGTVGWQRSFMVIGAFAVGLFWTTFFRTRERVQAAPERTAITRDLRDLLANRPWQLLVFATLLLILYVAVRSSVTVHYFRYVVGTRIWFGRSFAFDELVSVFNAVSQSMSLLGVLLLPRVTKRLGQKRTFVTLLLIATLATAAFYGVGPAQIELMMLLNATSSICGGPLSALLWAMYADTVDYSEWRTGRRATGLVFSASAFAQKQGWAIGAAGALALMDRMGFVANVESAGTTRALTLLMSVIPAAFALLSIFALVLYPLDEAKLQAITRELDARREAA